MQNNKSIIFIIIAFVLGFASFWVYSNLRLAGPATKVKDTQVNIDRLERESASDTEAPAATAKNSLDLSSQGLNKLPSYVTTKTNLEELNISNNKLTGALPSEIGKLTRLKVLNASNNLMTGVPAEIGHLPDLEVLDLSNNQLTGLPNELANLKKLKTLNLSGNDYSVQDLEVIKKGLPANVKIILN